MTLWVFQQPIKKLKFAIWIFGKVVDGKIVDNWVMVDFPSIRKLLVSDLSKPPQSNLWGFFLLSSVEGRHLSGIDRIALSTKEIILLP